MAPGAVLLISRAAGIGLLCGEGSRYTLLSPLLTK
jgi:hypothetical protein